jgi:hypothetical protein
MWWLGFCGFAMHGEGDYTLGRIVGEVLILVCNLVLILTFFWSYLLDIKVEGHVSRLKFCDILLLKKTLLPIETFLLSWAKSLNHFQVFNVVVQLSFSWCKNLHYCGILKIECHNFNDFLEKKKIISFKKCRNHYFLFIDRVDNQKYDLFIFPFIFD